MTSNPVNAFDIPPFTGQILSEYDVPAFVDALKDCDTLLEKARIIEDSRNRVGIVPIPDIKGKTELAVKEFRTKGLNRWKSLFVPSKAEKAWRGSLALVERGFLTPLPVAYLERRTSVFLDQSYFVAEYVPEIEEVRGLFRELSQDELIPLLRELAGYLARCTSSGILHRDLSDGNVMVGQKVSEGFRIYLLDTNRIRLRKRVGTFRGIKSLIRLGIPLELQRFFLTEYLLPSPIKRVHWLWYRANKSCFTGFIQLKKLLRLKQLAERLKIQ
jgi:serine/threonine protein kinase